FPLKKQSTGLFFNSPFAERPAAICGTLSHALQGLSALDLTKGLSTLWKPGFYYPILKSRSINQLFDTKFTVHRFLYTVRRKTIEKYLRMWYKLVKGFS
ncbi:MAG: hypothetical protein MR836_01950, partial [Ruminococcus sp.]|nr:hypothetical protein [Ruminococcus sp.]